jgi:hypothetical protein
MDAVTRETTEMRVYARQNLPGVVWIVEASEDWTEDESSAYSEWVVLSTLPQCYGWRLDGGEYEGDPEDALREARKAARKASDDAIKKGFVPEEVE